MNDTSISLLQRLRDEPDPQQWQRLVDLYEPLLRQWLRRYEVQAADQDDLLQDVLVAVSTELPKFDHNGRPGAFRAWLRVTLVNRLRNFWRARGRQAQAGSDAEQRLAELEDPGTALTQIWNREHDRHVLAKLLDQIEPHFAPATWQAFRRQAIDGARADEVARELGLSLNAVFIAKSRVLTRLRQEAEGIIESSSGFSASG